MRIDDLARRSNTTVRKIRDYTTRGILPPPKLVGRVGHYGEFHLRRLEHIRHMLDRGFSLAAIAELMKAWDEGLSITDVLGFHEALTTPWTEKGEPTPAEVIEKALPGLLADKNATKHATELGLIETKKDGSIAIRHKSVFDLAAVIVSGGQSVEEALAHIEHIHAGCCKVSDYMVGEFMALVYEPWLEAGRSPEKIADIARLIGNLREVVPAAISAFVADEIEKRIHDETARYYAMAPIPKDPG